MASRTYQIGGWRVEPDLNRISRGAVERHLEPQSMTTLVYLLERPNETVSPDALLNAVWSQRIVEPNAVPRVISDIRRALGDDPRNPRYIETIRKRGYRVMASVVHPSPRRTTRAGENAIAAHNLLQQASHEFLRTWDPGEPLRLAREASRLDPTSVRTHTHVAAYLTLLAEGNQIPPKEALIQARQAAINAVAIDPHSGDAHVLLGFISDRLDLDLAGALKSYEKAKSLGARREMLAAFSQDTLMSAGLLDRGLEACLEAAHLNPGIGTYRMYAGRFLFRLGRHDDACRSFGQALQLSPDNRVIVYDALRHLIRMNELGRAETVADRYIRANPAFRHSELHQEALARLSLARGDEGPLRQWVAAAVQRRDLIYVPAKQISNACFRLGDYGRHIDWFRTRVEERDHVGNFMDDLRRWKDYWARLDQWAVSRPDEALERSSKLKGHRRLVRKVSAGFSV